MPPTYDSAEFPKMGAPSQPTAGSSTTNPRSFFRTSLIWKLTLFVGVLVVINTALLIGAAYVTTSAILHDQIQDRLTTVAGDRQEILLHELNQQVERAVGFANRSRLRPLLIDRASGIASGPGVPERGRVVPLDRASQYHLPAGHLDRR